MAKSKDTTNNKKINSHIGHRARVRQRFIDEGSLDRFHDHQVLELLLFYAYPMKDTNEIAHRLLNQFGSLYNLFNASAAELMTRAGLTENVAVLLTMMPHINKKYLQSQFTKSEVLSNAKIACDYVSTLFNGQKYESLYMICLNVHKKVISVDEICKGGVSNVSVDSRKLIEKALLNSAKFVIISHNHPGGNCKPSTADLHITNKLINEFKIIDVILIDHIIVCNNKTYSFCINRNYNLSYNPVLD